jgi:tetratricopeptide (TPR) repeat protein
MGLITESIESLKKSVDKSSNFYEALHDLGSAYARINDYESALVYYFRCAKINDASYILLFNISRCLENLGRYEESIKFYDKVIQLAPNHAEAWFFKGNALSFLKSYDDAIEHYSHAIKLKPNFAEAWCNKGNSLHYLKHYQESIYCYDQAILLKPDYAEAWSNKGNTLHQLKRFNDSLSHFDRAIELKPDYSDSYWHKSLTKLLLGDFSEGFSLYRYRWKKTNSHKLRHQNIPELLSLDDVSNKKILVWCEQGFGDSIQFSRYVPSLAQMGSDVTFEVQESLVSLLTPVFPCVAPFESESDVFFDYQIPLLNLPCLFKTHINNVPKPTFFDIPESVIYEWRQKLSLSREKLNIGVAFSGNPTHANDHLRSMNPSCLRKFLDFGKIFLIQKQFTDSDRQFLAQFPEVIFLENELLVFFDSAAVVCNMDLIVSVDTSLIHLAGSLNKDAYLMLPWCPEWRWLLDVSDSPWYPSIKIFRQHSPDDWDSVVNQICLELSDSDKFLK